jgi:VanZ family protein
MLKRLQKILSQRYHATLWTIFIFVLMAIPGNLLPTEETTFIPNLDKLVHATLFGSFVFLWSYYFTARDNKISNRRYILVLIIASMYGVATELMQKYLIPMRDFSIFDIIADVTGAIIAYVVFLLTIQKIKPS